MKFQAILSRDRIENVTGGDFTAANQRDTACLVLPLLVDAIIISAYDELPFVSMYS